MTCPLGAWCLLDSSGLWTEEDTSRASVGCAHDGAGTGPSVLYTKIALIPR